MRRKRYVQLPENRGSLAKSEEFAIGEVCLAQQRLCESRPLRRVGGLYWRHASRLGGLDWV